MKIDASIIELGSRLDDWFQDSQGIFASQDRMAQRQALLSGFELVKELDRLKSEGMAALTRLLSGDGLASSNERVASLLRGFEFGAKLGAVLHDELLDTDGQTAVSHLMDQIVLALNDIHSGRAALTALFDHPDAAVRVKAGAYLIDLMPDRVVPLLKQVDGRSDGSGASFTAHWALLAWERERKSRFNYLSANRAQG